MTNTCLKLKDHSSKVATMEQQIDTVARFASVTCDFGKINRLRSDVLREKEAILADIKSGHFTFKDASDVMRECNMMIQKLKDAQRMAVNAKMKSRRMGAC